MPRGLSQLFGVGHQSANGG